MNIFIYHLITWSDFENKAGGLLPHLGGLMFYVPRYHSSFLTNESIKLIINAFLPIIMLSAPVTFLKKL